MCLSFYEPRITDKKVIGCGKFKNSLALCVAFAITMATMNVLITTNIILYLYHPLYASCHAVTPFLFQKADQQPLLLTPLSGWIFFEVASVSNYLNVRCKTRASGPHFKQL